MNLASDFRMLITKKRVVAIVCLLIYLAIVFRNAWLGDDAFITMRTVDNFVAHYRPIWNPGQRIQTFTHPLWFMVLTLVYFINQDPYFTLYAVSLLFTSLTAILLLFRLAPNTPMVLISFALMISSKSFVEFSTSGLENPLSHFLTLAYIIVLFKHAIPTNVKIFLLTLLSSLAALNRFDIFLIFLPSLVYEVYLAEISRRKVIRYLFFGSLPLLLWVLFSTFYYGFPLPNTYYAKIHTGIPLGQYVNQGKNYFLNSFSWDPVTLSTIMISLLIFQNSIDQKQRVFFLGIFLYLLYVLRIGGDFMSGRFFSITFIASVALLSTSNVSNVIRSVSGKWLTIMLLIIFSHSISNDHSAVLFSLDITNYKNQSENGIADEKLYYYEFLGLQNLMGGTELHFWAQNGQIAKSVGNSPIRLGSIGLFGYYAGSEIYILDNLSLADPLRARLPVIDLDQRIGHFERPFPAGYIDAIRLNNASKIEDPYLREYYLKLSQVISGELLDVERLATLIELNFGKYDYLLDEYLILHQGPESR